MMLKREEEFWTTYEVDAAELDRLAPETTGRDQIDFATWLRDSPFYQANDGAMFILRFPPGPVDLDQAGCPKKFRKVVKTFLDVTEDERRAQPTLLKLELSLAGSRSIEA